MNLNDLAKIQMATSDVAFQRVRFTTLNMMLRNGDAGKTFDIVFNTTRDATWIATYDAVTVFLNEL